MSFNRALFWIAAVTCVAAELLILRSAFLGRSGPARADASAARRAMELAWTIVPAIALAAVLFFTWRAIERVDALQPTYAERLRLTDSSVP